MDAIYAANKGIYLVIMLSLLPVTVATVVGLTVGLLQTVTQIQEQTLPFGLKLIAVFICILMQLTWLGDSMLNYAREMFSLALSATAAD
ncbi:EscS/YscS/HrcS family type III secretion system export apparatus protein [Morganella morganii]|uniref:EscS/YscS/HrcS family type III secretion system export apparatus protein n=1 Tax=Morganella morganii TaxID=582 RepID=A0A433ZYB4_MORMO|nr:type III secretion system export apparatus subunit SctS [Morganella morganii]RUT67125.1 EscS/YscS/HrcS family type III secretion system export apparatus protein [Morganella morganii]